MVTKHSLMLGDSHLEALQLAADLGILSIASSHFSIVPGATVVGLRNPNSLTDVVNIFRASLLAQATDSYVIIHFGEVDCGFVIWWRAMRFGESVGIHLQESIDAYSKFLDEILARGFTKICIAGESLPTIHDGADSGGISNRRSEMDVGITQRTELTFRYNWKLRDLASRTGISYFDISNAVLNQSSNLIHDFFRCSDHKDRHLDQQKTVGVWACKCNAFVEGSL